MSRCEVCGNEYDKSFTIEVKGQSHVFDSFECAFKRSHHSVPIVIVESLDMEWKAANKFIAAPIVPARQDFRRLPIGQRRSFWAAVFPQKSPLTISPCSYQRQASENGSYGTLAD
jgi:hypothetical protein